MTFAIELQVEPTPGDSVMETPAVMTSAALEAVQAADAVLRRIGYHVRVWHLQGARA